MTPLPARFPRLNTDYRLGQPDANPGIQLFGRRFFSDQTGLEFLSELLLVVNSPKRIGPGRVIVDSPFPSWEEIQTWPPEKPLEYKAPVRLNLKLFALLGASRLATRHESHREQYKTILRGLERAIRSDEVEKRDILKSLENLYLGFQGVGFDRTWCAQTFFPISKSFLCQETLWNETEAKRVGSFSWSHALREFKTLFSVSKHRFLARGGELLYLQLCNAFRQRTTTELNTFLQIYDISEDEADPERLLSSLQEGLKAVASAVPEALDQIADLIDRIDGATWTATNREDSFTACGWCPEESWPESYLFAIELNRICQAALDPVERIELLVVACSLQVLRSLSAQAVRYEASRVNWKARSMGNPLNYVWIISDPFGTDRVTKHLSQRNLQMILSIIHGALRNEAIRTNVAKHNPSNRDVERLYDEADDRYGQKLLLSLGKRLGLIIPKRGPGARFVMTDRILRFLVLSLIPPGQSRSFVDLKTALFGHYGIAMEGDELQQCLRWSGFPTVDAQGGADGNWLASMLRASGFLTDLSDAHALVHNPFHLRT